MPWPIHLDTEVKAAQPTIGAINSVTLSWRAIFVTAALSLLCACGGDPVSNTPVIGGTPIAAAKPPPSPKPIVGVTQTTVVPFASPWAMAMMPDNRLLVTDNQAKSLTIVGPGGAETVSGLPGMAGIYDVEVSPYYAYDNRIYLTFAEPSPPGTPRNGPYAYPDYIANPATFQGVLALATAQLDETTGTPILRNVKVIWRQTPQIVAGGEFGGRIAFSPDAQYLFVTAGDRGVYPPAKSLDNTLGKIVRLNLDGTIPPDNPFVNTPGALGEIWSLGHRNPYGLAFAPDGRLWSSEHGPKGGDEFNLVIRGANYGWPDVSYGDKYDGTPLPKPAEGDGFAPSAFFWTPAIAPAGMIFYSGAEFAYWQGDVLLTGLVSKALIRVHIDGNKAAEVQRFDLGGRIREVEQGPNGSLYVLVDSEGKLNGRLVRLTPVF